MTGGKWQILCLTRGVWKARVYITLRYRFQSGLCPPHPDENAIGKVTHLLTAEFGGFFYVIGCDISAALTPFASLTLQKLCNVTSYLSDNSFCLLSILLFCLLLGLLLVSGYPHTDYCWAILLMFHAFHHILLTSKSLFSRLETWWYTNVLRMFTKEISFKLKKQDKESIFFIYNCFQNYTFSPRSHFYSKRNLIWNI